jgi:predicted molibdopterin-dependent oxidoreductase YjgC
VAFDAIPAIAPAGEIVLKIRAKADVAGNHVFRAEVRCKTTGTRLVREEVTHYYQDGPTLQQTAAPAAPAPMPPQGPDPMPRDTQRTAEREAPLPLPQSQSTGTPVPTPAIRR